MRLAEIAKSVETLLIDQGHLIRLPIDRTIVYVGDTHGDRDATERILDRYPVEEHVLVFLGDTVDRGPDSPGNLSLILETKLHHPSSLYLLMGNHEVWAAAPFSPADFWDGLSPADRETMTRILSYLPYAAFHPAGVLALHGALPDLPSLDHIERVTVGSPAWRSMTWGDCHETEAYETSIAWGRPSFSRADFDRRSRQLEVQVLVRSHQPFAPTHLYDERCLTIFSSSAYGDGRRRVAILHPETQVHSAADLDLKDI